MLLLKWKSEYSVGVEAMDAQHQRLFELLNQLHDGIQQERDSANEELRNVLVSLFEYAKTHFNEEEQLMRRHFYPGMEQHVKQHGELVEKLVDKIELFEMDKLTATKLAIFLKDWILTHMIESDKKYGDFIKMRLINRMK